MSKKSEREAAAAMAAAGASAKPIKAVKVKKPAAAVEAAAPAANPVAPRAGDLNPMVIIPSPLNPRRGMEADGLDELMQSIVQNGLLQPILVRPVPILRAAELVPQSRMPPEYEVICGARRLAAVTEAMMQDLLPGDYRIPARIRDCNDSELVLLAATENLARADMHPLDEAAVFQAMRPHVTPGEGQTVEAAIGRALGVSQRTVFRRLTLLRCAPEVQEALREKKITLAHAQTYSMGPVEKQRELIAAQLDGEHNVRGNSFTVDDLRYELVEENDALVPTGYAIFDPAAYQGAIIEDPETEDRFFTDKAEFNRLQDLALAAKVAELKAQWPWVDIDKKGWLDGWQTHRVRQDDPEAGAVIQLRREGAGINIVAPALRDATVKDRNRAEVSGRISPSNRETPSAASGTDAKPPAPRPPLSQLQLEQLHATKTRALRRAVIARSAHQGRVPIALACLGLMGALEIRGMAPKQEHSAGYGDRVHAVESLLSESGAIAHILKTAALDLPVEFKRSGPFDAAFTRNSAATAAWFGALMNLPPDDLYELHARLVAERIGSWLPIDKDDRNYDGSPLSKYLPRLGDSPLACAIATYTGAAEHLADTWTVERNWFEQYGKDRLFAMALGQCRVRNANTLKKTQLVDIVVEQPKGFWTVSLFPEANFQSEAEAAKALDLAQTPLPMPDLERVAAE